MLPASAGQGMGDKQPTQSCPNHPGRRMESLLFASTYMGNGRSKDQLIDQPTEIAEQGGSLSFIFGCSVLGERVAEEKFYIFIFYFFIVVKYT